MYGVVNLYGARINYFYNGKITAITNIALNI
jgi:hypothetical protein